MITSDNSSASILHLLHRAGQCADEIFADSIGESSLTPRQYEVLNAVSSSEEPSQTLLVELTGIDRSTLADIVRRLVERGLLERRRTRQDARMYAVKLSAEGETMLKSAEPAVKAVNERLLCGLTNGEREAVIGALSRIIASASTK
ncbi:MAG: MarR family winged helix-turn-helix transcriptional regulator [Alphaproteobacteria bacterium]|nr:MarR family winged helix-turn-helix transcriptional regulator [Alphaproteobacteria bacterium]